jgi:predicted ATPase
MEVYNLNPKEIGSLQKPDPGEILRRDGSNVASVLQLLPNATQDLINDYLPRIVKGITKVEPKVFGDQETIQFRQVVKGQKAPWNFHASSMSDGTLRALGILLAVFQAGKAGLGAPLVIGLEEPEIALHPAALGVLLSALREGAQTRQILVTSHSPDLLDNQEIGTDSLLAVENVDGITTIAPIDSAGRELLREKLFTPGELLRQNQLSPDNSKVLTDVQRESQLNLFEFESDAP